MPAMETKVTISNREILNHPGGDWFVHNGSDNSSDVSLKSTTLRATICGTKVELISTDYDPGSFQRPNRIGSGGHHHWNSAHPLFDQVAAKIVGAASAELQASRTNLQNMILESKPEQWERGPIQAYRGGVFTFAGCRYGYHPEEGLCEEGYVGRLGRLSVLARRMRSGAVEVELALSKGDYYQSVKLPDADAAGAFFTIRQLL